MCTEYAGKFRQFSRNFRRSTARSVWRHITSRSIFVHSWFYFILHDVYIALAPRKIRPIYTDSGGLGHRLRGNSPGGPITEIIKKQIIVLRRYFVQDVTILKSRILVFRFFFEFFKLLEIFTRYWIDLEKI